jgi:DNA-binding NarL/FixJ family response regulator
MRAGERSATVRSVGQTVLIVDDHADFRSAARALLEAGGFDVVGEAADGASALGAVHDLRPAVVLLDVCLPDVDGFAVAERLATDGASATIVLTSSRAAATFRRRLATNPAWTFIPKSELTAAALAAAAGRAPESP